MVKNMIILTCYLCEEFLTYSYSLYYYRDYYCLLGNCILVLLFIGS